MLFNEPIPINLEDAEIIYNQQIFNKSESDTYFNHLLEHIPWKQDLITVYGKTHLQPRLTALFGNNEKPYTYSNITMSPMPFSPTLLIIKSQVEDICGTNFTTCLANLYRHGNDSNGWHADNEKELGPAPLIASVSFGAERFFHLKHKTKKQLKHKIKLEHGSLLIMKGSTQEHWLHQIPKTRKIIGERINLTFRIIA